MNESGMSVRAASDYYSVAPERILVVHDDIDLPFGRFRVQVGGGSGGHNGIRSIEGALGMKEFTRLKLGVGRPPGSMDPADYVLRSFPKTELVEVELMLTDAADVILRWPLDPVRAQEMAALRDRP
jgi:PTH1 family peptidyl-tRNA hydrolase